MWGKLFFRWHSNQHESQEKLKLDWSNWKNVWGKKGRASGVNGLFNKKIGEIGGKATREGSLFKKVNQ